jgi:rhodanese-related sulfurtransferase
VRQTATVEPALVEIDCESLREKIASGEAFVLVDALPAIAYAGAHLPGAVNIPPARVDDLAPRRIPDSATEVVVYCANPDCESSIEVGQRLLELGYLNVRHFSGGKQAWRDAGLPLEGGRV